MGYEVDKIAKIIDEISILSKAINREKDDSERFIMTEKRNLWISRITHYVNTGRLM